MWEALVGIIVILSTCDSSAWVWEGLGRRDTFTVALVITVQVCGWLWLGVVVLL